jgi:hypothetical protein
VSDTGGRAYQQRKARREDGGRDQVRDAYQRVLIGAALRRELHALGSGERDAKAGLDKSASAIAQAVGDSAVGRWASGRLDARRNRAGELYGLADALGVVDALRLWELEPADLRALGLYGESSADA